MTEITCYAYEDTPDLAKPNLNAVNASPGFIPNLHVIMAKSPELPAGCTALWDLLSQTTPMPHEQEIVYKASNFENERHDDVAGHRPPARTQKMDPAVITALRSGTELPDQSLKALHQSYALGVRDRGWVSDAHTDAFIVTSFTPRNILDVILDVATKVVSDYTNHIADTRLAPFMRDNEWATPPTSVA